MDEEGMEHYNSFFLGMLDSLIKCCFKMLSSRGVSKEQMT